MIAMPSFFRHLGWPVIRRKAGAAVRFVGLEPVKRRSAGIAAIEASTVLPSRPTTAVNECAYPLQTTAALASRPCRARIPMALVGAQYTEPFNAVALP